MQRAPHRIATTGLVICAVAIALLALRRWRRPGDHEAPATALRSGTEPARGASAERRFLAGTWTTRVVVPGALDGPLLRPTMLRADGTHLYTYDFGDEALKAFDRTGHQLWTVGRQGRGPGEFENPTDMKVDEDGNLWVMDPRNGRMTIVGRNGDRRAVFDICNAASLRFALLPGGAYAELGPSASAPFAVRCDSTSTHQSRLQAPAWLDTLPSMGGGVRVASSRDGSHSAATFFYGGGLLWMDGASGRVRPGRAIEGHSLPRPVTSSPRPGLSVTRLPPGTTVWARAIAMDSARVYVLFHGTAPERSRIVDSYAIDGGQYLGSYLLPEQAADIAPVDGGFVILTTGELVAIEELDWHPAT